MVLETTGARKRYPWRGQGFDVERTVGVVAQHLADLLDALVDAVLEIDVGLLAPELGLDFLAGNDLPGVGGEQDEELKRLRREFDDGAGFAQLKGVEIELEDPEAEQFLRGAHTHHLKAGAVFAPDYNPIRPPGGNAVRSSAQSSSAAAIA